MTRILVSTTYPIELTIFAQLIDLQYLTFIDLEILKLSDTETCGTYVFDFHKGEHGRRRRALIFARQQLLQEMQKRNLTILLEEEYVFLPILYLVLLRS